MRSAILFVALLLSGSLSATTSFVQPQDGAQAIGPMHLEIKTDLVDVNRVDFHVDGVLIGVARQAPYRIAHDFGVQAAVRTITATVWSAGYTKSEKASVTTTALSTSDRIHVELVEVPVRVRSTKPVKASDITVHENGVEQKIRDVRSERPPAHFAFIVDRSLSMGDGRLPGALRAIEGELTQLRAGDTASLILFNHLVSRPQPIARSQKLQEIANTTPPSGGTSLRDALASVASRERTYAIVITDGGDRSSRLSDEEALRKISGTRTIVNVIALGRAHARFLDRAAQNTGGRVVEASGSAIRTSLRDLLADINSRHLIVYQSSHEGRGWRDVRVSSRNRRLRVEHGRKGYFAE